MGIENLENAARAAGFAMAADEPLNESAPLVAPAQGDAVLRPAVIDNAADKAQAFTEWVKGVMGSNGRRATA